MSERVFASVAPNCTHHICVSPPSGQVVCEDTHHGRGGAVGVSHWHSLIQPISAQEFLGGHASFAFSL